MDFTQYITDKRHREIEIALKKIYDDKKINEKNKADIKKLDQRAYNEGCTLNSRVTIIKSWRIYAKYLKDTPFKDVKRSQIDDFISELLTGKATLSKKPASNATINNIIMLTIKLYKMLYNVGMREELP